MSKELKDQLVNFDFEESFMVKGCSNVFMYSQYLSEVMGQSNQK